MSPRTNKPPADLDIVVDLPELETPAEQNAGPLNAVWLSDVEPRDETAEEAYRRGYFHGYRRATSDLSDLMLFFRFSREAAFGLASRFIGDPLRLWMRRQTIGEKELPPSLETYRRLGYQEPPEAPWQPGQPLTWTELVRREPKLQKLLAEIRRIRPKPGRPFCANRHWFELYDWRLDKLVGWHTNHPDPEMRTSRAYDTAFEVLYEALPDCRDCGCA